jgi:hypothetical protein
LVDEFFVGSGDINGAFLLKAPTLPSGDSPDTKQKPETPGPKPDSPTTEEADKGKPSDPPDPLRLLNSPTGLADEAIESVAATLADQVQTRPLLRKQEALKKERAKERDKERSIQPVASSSGGKPPCLSPCLCVVLIGIKLADADETTDEENGSDADSPPLLNNDDRELDKVFRVG